MNKVWVKKVKGSINIEEYLDERKFEVDEGNLDSKPREKKLWR